MNYDLSHLTQKSSQESAGDGAIQDDEALLLFSLCKTMLIKNVVEVGSGYSTENFIKAVGRDGHVISVDINFKITNIFMNYYNKFNWHRSDRNFTFINKNISNVRPCEIPWVIDLVFFDSHDELAQLVFYNNMVNSNKIDDDTVIAIHDTNLHPRDPQIHQPAERSFVNKLIDYGWSQFHVHTKLNRHNSDLPYRHGLTLLNKKKYLALK